jgi:hypothetical protein
VFFNPLITRRASSFPFPLTEIVEIVCLGGIYFVFYVNNNL